MRVRLFGWAGLSPAAMSAVAANAAGQGWQTASTWAPGPMYSRKAITWPM